MKYCIEHDQKAYTEKAFEKIKVCEMSGTYQDIKDGKIRVYCFIASYGKEAVCPKKEK